MQAQVIPVVPKRVVDFATLPVGATEDVILADRIDVQQWRELTLLLRVHSHSLLSTGAGTITILALPLGWTSEDPAVQFVGSSLPACKCEISNNIGSPAYLTAPAPMQGPSCIGPMVRLIARGSRSRSGAMNATISIDLAGKNGTPNALPSGVSSCVLWLSAAQGVTLSSALGNDFGAWGLTNLTRTSGQADPLGGTGGFQFTDTNDATPQQHTGVDTPTNTVSGPCFLDVWVKAGTLSWCAFQPCQNVIQFFNIATGTFGYNQAVTSAKILQQIGPWYQIRIAGDPLGANVQTVIYTATGDGPGGATYQGAGTGTIFAFNPVLTQQRISAHADQSGKANDATQGTAASQMLWRFEDGLPAFGWPADASKGSTLPAAFSSMWNGNGVPMTIIELRKQLAVNTNNSTSALYMPGTTAQIQVPNNASNGKIRAAWQDDSGTLLSVDTSTSYPVAKWFSSVFVYDGASGFYYSDGVGDAANPMNLDVGTQTLTSASVNAVYGMRREFAVYNRALSLSEWRAVMNGMRERWGWLGSERASSVRRRTDVESSTASIIYNERVAAAPMPATARDLSIALWSGQRGAFQLAPRCVGIRRRPR